MKLIAALILLSILSCNNPLSKKDKDMEESLTAKENELLRKELELKDREIAANKKMADASLQVVPIAEIYKRIKGGVFLVYAKGLENISQGTGFFINSEGIAISNYHVFENADSAIVILDNKQKCMISKILTFDKALDYVIFQVDNLVNANVALQITDTISEIGSTCFAVGNPYGLTQTLSIGNISGYRNGDNLIQTTTEITKGSSGGPLFNTAGKVIGITSSGIGEANLNFALNINKVKYQVFLKSTNQISEQEAMPTQKIADFIRNYYSYIKKDNFKSLYNSYASEIDRYYDYFNISSEKAVSIAQQYKSKFKIIDANYVVNWVTLNVSNSWEGNYFVTFNMQVNLIRTEKNKPKAFNLNISMILTKELKIKSIYENILSGN